jgi:hypothetical protein
MELKLGKKELSTPLQETPQTARGAADCCKNINWKKSWIVFFKNTKGVYYIANMSDQEALMKLFPGLVAQSPQSPATVAAELKKDVSGLF